MAGYVDKKQAATVLDPSPRKRFRAEDMEHLLNLHVDLDDDELMAEGDTTSWSQLRCPP